MAEQPEAVSARQRYEQLATDRQPYLDRARECSKLTIPALIPPNETTKGSKLYTPYQSLGARGVNNLASKMLLALLPPNAAFFRLTPDSKAGEGEKPEDVALVEKGLSSVEQKVRGEMDKRALRVYAFEAFKHLIVGGNVLLHIPTKGVRVFPLTQFVVERDPEGSVLEIVVKECVSPKMLPDEIRQTVDKQMKDTGQKTVDVYTRVQRRNNGDWTVGQSAFDIDIPGTEGTYVADKCPWVALRWTRIDGENYGRGLCEEYLGDLSSLEGLQQSVVDIAAAAARLLILVNPNGATELEDIQNAPNGAVRYGIEEEVSVLQIEKLADLTITSGVVDRLEQRLSYAFLLNTAVQRNAERVTAEEVRYMAGEIEQALGGVYTVMAEEFQLPLVKVIMAQMMKSGHLPALPENSVHPAIVTGIDALSRSGDRNRLQTYLAGLTQILGPEVVARYIVPSNLMARLAAADGIDTDGLIRTEEEVSAAQQQQQQADIAGKAAPSFVKAVSDQLPKEQ